MKRLDLIGNVYGKLTVLEMIYKKDKNMKQRCYCRCKCECGNETIILSDSLRRKGLHSCGCARKEIVSKSCGMDINGKKFGRLTVLETYWNEYPPKVRCLCDCGNEVIRRKNDVQSLHTQSCGCLQKDEASKSNTKDWTGFVSDYGVKIINRSSKNDKGQWLWMCECPLCGKLFEILPIKIKDGHTTSCGCRIQSSSEYLISNILKQNDVKFIPQYSFPDCKYKYKLKFDFAVFKNNELNCLIEYDGKQHYEMIEFFGGNEGYNKTVKRDKIKNDYCKAHNIPLYRFTYKLSNKEIEEKIINII